ncbi:MAG: anti-sigma factor [Chloroflexota bacterium]
MAHNETYYVMMMDALDGELTAVQRTELESHLRACPECAREWEALAALDTLFRQAPLLSPAADFAERTIGLLPNRRTRVWALTAVYTALLISGVIPVILGVWLISRYTPVLTNPDLLQHVWSSMQGTAQVFATVIDALLAGAGRVVAEQPMILGLAMLMAGMVFLWGGVIQRLVVQPRSAGSRN